jgi:hypothetical protein
MRYSAPQSRRAFIEGARAAFDAALVTLDPREARMIAHWIEVDLADWTGGEPPPAPQDWT